MKKKTVFVGISGGVDSSVAAFRLKNSGCNVVGVFIKVWQPDFILCNWEQERLDAMRVAAQLNIPFLTFDAEKVYKKEVADYMISEYKNGRTPNPDVSCNQYVKFGAFLNFAKENGAEYVATGHYAQVRQTGESPFLLRGIDKEKDQSYFLWALTTVQLQHVLFPVGDTKKEYIRNEAAQAGLPTSEKKDSQGICFLGQIDIPEFLSHYIDLKKGTVQNEKGEIIGKQNGALIYTMGQRHGFELTKSYGKPHYVIARDIEKNTITVSTKRPVLHEKRITLSNVNQIIPLSEGMECTAQFRYRQTPFPVKICELNDQHAIVEVLEDTETPSEGQSCVFYNDDMCLGGGIIAYIHANNQS